MEAEIVYAKATKADIWKAYKEVIGSKGDVCDGRCSEPAIRYVKFRATQFHFTRPGLGYGIEGPVILFCPYCGKELKHA